jgi:hypothetical protein
MCGVIRLYTVPAAWVPKVHKEEEMLSTLRIATTCMECRHLRKGPMFIIRCNNIDCSTGVEKILAGPAVYHYGLPYPQDGCSWYSGRYGLSIPGRRPAC